MEKLKTLMTHRTHLFPGARLESGSAFSSERSEILVLFSDGARAEAVLTPTSAGYSLRVDDYRTAAGTSISSKTWSLELESGGTLRVNRANGLPGDLKAGPTP